ncbi:HPP family protein [Novosphingobium sp. FGD1]|jgi:CBS domain-containing membrane protein|uniref:HPP family protein n=1 Tax=Novosphingobium silvae TaxID=2692619 RepID=A0A7X4K4W5_9SPHN|nr:HPP family protein [Novosphingobium silvae]MYL96351.1 HPP family protein [Novosphingobium silvae]
MTAQSATADWRARAMGHLGWARGAIGAGLGIALAGGITWLMLRVPAGGSMQALPFLVAPLGASAVLVFCVPASPLAQPWPVIGGDLLSAMIGIAAGHLIGDPWMAGSVAVGAAIAVMSLARCLHPPGGACALLCALGASGPAPWDWSWMAPIAVNVLLLCATGWLYNNLTGHPWPHRPPRVPHVALAPAYTREDIVAVLEDWNEVLDVDVDDLDAFVQALLRRGRG